MLTSHNSSAYQSLTSPSDYDGWGGDRVRDDLTPEDFERGSDLQSESESYINEENKRAYAGAQTAPAHRPPVNPPASAPSAPRVTRLPRADIDQIRAEAGTNEYRQRRDAELRNEIYGAHETGELYEQVQDLVNDGLADALEEAALRLRLDTQRRRHRRTGGAALNGPNPTGPVGPTPTGGGAGEAAIPEAEPTEFSPEASNNEQRDEHQESVGTPETNTGSDDEPKE